MRSFARMLALIGVSLGTSLATSMGSARAAEKMTFQMSWRAQAENAGYYQALIHGDYAACGIDMTIRQGGAGIDTTQLLTGAGVDAALVSQNDGVMRMNAAGFAARAVMAGFQRLPSTLDVHPDSGINTMADMRGHPIMLSAGNRNTFWPFLKQKFGFTDDQLRTFTGQFAPFLADKTVVVQDLITNGPFLMKRDAGFEVKPFLLADVGYQPYSSLVTVPQAMIDAKPQVVQCLVDASRAGWVAFFKDPKAAFAEIQKIAPENTPDLLQYAFATMQQYHVVETDETAALGIGAMTDARWKSHFDMLVDSKLFPADFDYRTSYTLRFLGQPPR
jgi:NitT/TauT family transport system substrate-binding protein